MLIGYDLETTRIESGTPRLLYITAYGDQLRVSLPIVGHDRLEHLKQILESSFLLPEFNKAMFVAWNANNFDAYFVAAALLKSDRWQLFPYMTASKALRGLKVKSKHKIKIDGKMRVLQFQFLDGISMTGLVGKTLKSFLATFAPDLPKLNIGNLESVTFDPENAAHRAYAERDSEGLYKGMMNVAGIIDKLTGGLALKPTVGNLAITYFMVNTPPGADLKKPSSRLAEVLHGPVKRGGYCWCQRQYTGLVWKYDINQAYAAAMRDAALPCGEVTETERYIKGLPGIYSVSFKRSRPSKIPFYYKRESEGRFTLGGDPVTTWLTSIEIEHLRADKWEVQVYDGFYWENSFNFAAVVGNLELLRRSDPGGPGGPLGTMVKAIGNNAYGKTLEMLNGMELLIARECPPGWDVYDPFNDLDVPIFSRTRAPYYKNYHLPQIGVFVTAHVRCIIRETALRNADAFLYADTDCVCFSKPMQLDIDKTRYGAWKIEAEGVPYIIIGKKVYFGDDGAVKAKGLQTKKLSRADYAKWLIEQPSQNQVQRQNFLKFLSGSAMFKDQERRGTNVENSQVYGVKKGRYVPK